MTYVAPVHWVGFRDLDAEPIRRRQSPQAVRRSDPGCSDQVESQPARRRDPRKPFTVLVMADSRSSFSRKNPAAAVDAFRRAFGNDTSTRLIVKLTGRPADVEPLAASVRNLPNAGVVVDFLDEVTLARLYRSADVLLSLHRAEGFGLPMLEAMSHGVPVIGTGWSGNMEFMSEANSLFVPFQLVPVQDEAGIYANGMWAEPDIDAAAALLRQLARDDDMHTRLARAAHDSVGGAAWKLPADVGAVLQRAWSKVMPDRRDSARADFAGAPLRPNLPRWPDVAVGRTHRLPVG